MMGAKKYEAQGMKGEKGAAPSPRRKIGGSIITHRGYKGGKSDIEQVNAKKLTDPGVLAK